jgi:glycosyltransferase involved in cell wall biosynthesis
MTRYAVVIPAYNEASTIREVAIGALEQVGAVIVVDDGSVDGTAGALAGLPVLLLRNSANCGKAASLVRGMEAALAAGVDAVISLDGDGQHAPRDIPKLIEAYEGDPDALVIGARLLERGNIPRERYLANRFANFWIAWAAGQPIADSQSGFRLYPAALLRSVRPRCDRAASFVFESEIVIDAGRRGIKLVAVPVQARYAPQRRRSHFRPIVDIARIVRMVAWKLLARGMDLPGLARSLRATDTCKTPAPCTRRHPPGHGHTSPTARRGS